MSMSRYLLYRSEQFRSHTGSATRVSITSKKKDQRVNMTSRLRTRISLDKLLSGIFDDDFGLTDRENSYEEGEDVYAYSGSPWRGGSNQPSC